MDLNIGMGPVLNVENKLARTGRQANLRREILTVKIEVDSVHIGTSGGRVCF